MLSVSRVQLAFCKGNANERKESLLSISRVQLAFCKVSANRVKGKGKRHIYLHRRRAGGAVRCPAGGCHGREKCLPAGLRRHAACRSAVRNRPFCRLARPVSQGKTACFARPAGRGPQVAGGQRGWAGGVSAGEVAEDSLLRAARPHGCVAQAPGRCVQRCHGESVVLRFYGIWAEIQSF